jgi:hypothetical protein
VVVIAIFKILGESAREIKGKGGLFPPETEDGLRAWKISHRELIGPVVTNWHLPKMDGRPRRRSPAF